MVVAAGCWSSSRVEAAVSVNFDSADSNIGAGLYAFTLVGAPTTAVFGNFNSTFTITGWAAPSIGNDVVIASIQAPSAWNLPQNTSNDAEWDLQSTSPPNNVVDGLFEVQAKANLHGQLLWQLGWPADNTYTSSGFVTISAVPEPGTYGVLTATVLLGLVIAERSRREARL